MSYAAFKTGGKQYKVAVGDKLDVEKIDGEVGSEVSFDEVLLKGDANEVTVGEPMVAGSSVKAKIVDQYRAKKKVAFKFKRRKGFHLTKGYRRALTRLEITAIS